MEGKVEVKHWSRDDVAREKGRTRSGPGQVASVNSASILSMLRYEHE